jgi:hypothetical protein
VKVAGEGREDLLEEELTLELRGGALQVNTLQEDKEGSGRGGGVLSSPVLHTALAQRAQPGVERLGPRHQGVSS